MVANVTKISQKRKKQEQKKLIELEKMSYYNDKTVL